MLWMGFINTFFVIYDPLKDMVQFVDSRYLLSVERDEITTFSLKLKKDGDDREASYELTCNRVLRVVPEKRLVCLGIWEGRSVVAKFF